MTSEKPKSPASPQLAKQIDSAVAELIGEQVISLLGRPPNFFNLQIRNLWGDRYRANVFVGPNAAAATINHSFFLVTDGAGNITASNPPIARTF
jgi:hypothetical protein